MSTKENQERLVEILKTWQHVENHSIAQTAGIIDRTANPVIRLVMEIIQRDSAMHFRVQQFIIDSIESRAVDHLRVEDLEKVWDAIQAHVEAERKTEELIREAQKALAGTKSPVQQYLLSYLGQDEAKHDRLLEDLDLLKRGMFKSA
jgi:hypothetical protein